jgi:hypothetical protein
MCTVRFPKPRNTAKQLRCLLQGAALRQLSLASTCQEQVGGHDGGSTGLGKTIAQ